MPQRQRKDYSEVWFWFPHPSHLLGLVHCLVQSKSRNISDWSTWVAQSVRRPTSAQFMISRFMSSSPTSGSVLTAWSLESASDSVSPSLSAPPLLAVSLSKINKH